LIRSLQHPGCNLKGMRRADLKPFLTNILTASITRQFWLLRKLAIIKIIMGTDRYCLTRLGRRDSGMLLAD
jgi:hypothetical protein